LYDSVLAYPVDCQTTDLVFNDVFLMSQVGPEFQIKLELYSYCLEGPETSAARTLMSVLRARLRRKKERDIQDISWPEFLHTATAVLTIENASNDEKCHQLIVTEQGPEVADRVPPLFGDFCCRLAVKPYYLSETAPPVHSGQLTMSWSGSDIVITDCTARLTGPRFQLWTAVQLRSDSRPWQEILLSSTSRVHSKPERLQFSIVDPLDKVEEEQKTEFVCGSPEELEGWLTVLNRRIEDSRLWRQAAASAAMEIFSPSRAKMTVGRRRANYLQNTTSRLLLAYNRISGVNISHFSHSTSCTD
jgi:hypothetical protein